MTGKGTTLHVEVEFVKELLGTQSNDPELHANFIASKAPDALKREEEIAAIGVVEYEERGMTVFPRDADGTPILWPHQVIGFFKETTSALRKADPEFGPHARKLAAHKKRFDLNAFVLDERIRLDLPPRGFVGDFQRPLRAQTPKGERVAIAHSETVPAGTRCRFDLLLTAKDLVPVALECLEYGVYHGMGQWRNAGHGRFVCLVTDVDGNALLDTREGIARQCGGAA